MIAVGPCRPGPREVSRGPGRHGPTTLQPPTRARQHSGHGHGPAALPLALLGGFHEGHDLDRLLGAHGRRAGLEELRDLLAELLVAGEAARRGNDAVAAEDDEAVVRLVLADAAEGADPAVLPDARD